MNNPDSPVKGWRSLSTEQQTEVASEGLSPGTEVELQKMVAGIMDASSKHTQEDLAGYQEVLTLAQKAGVKIQELTGHTSAAIDERLKEIEPVIFTSDGTVIEPSGDAPPPMDDSASF